jgi:hypothetical protein
VVSVWRCPCRVSTSGQMAAVAPRRVMGWLTGWLGCWIDCGVQSRVAIRWRGSSSNKHNCKAASASKKKSTRSWVLVLANQAPEKCLARQISGPLSHGVSRQLEAARGSSSRRNSAKLETIFLHDTPSSTPPSPPLLHYIHGSRAWRWMALDAMAPAVVTSCRRATISLEVPRASRAAADWQPCHCVGRRYAPMPP